MSSRKIKAELKKKGYHVKSIVYQRSCPTPSGYGAGYDLEFIEDGEVEDYVFCNSEEGLEFGGLMEFDDLTSVLDWVEGLPVLTEELSLRTEIIQEEL